MFKRTTSLSDYDPELWAAVGAEIQRQEDHIELIASENYASPAVMAAQGSQLTNKYAEGYPGKRYYGGCEFVDIAETIAIERLKKVFGVQYANVQPHSGAQANQAVFLALLQPGDTFLGLSLAEGGHLTHGMALNLSGKWFKPVAYGLTKDELIDYDAMRAQARAHKPKIIIGGGSAYSMKWDWKKMREIADEVGALLMTDIAHYAGLVAAGVYPSPVGHAHVITSTTHKTLRGPRGGIIMTNEEELAKKFNSAVFPGLQGGPLMHVIAAKAVAFGEALKPEFKTYQQNVLNNARALSDSLKAQGLRIISGGTESHLMLVDLRAKKITGKLAEAALGAAHITVNKNAIPNDPEKAMTTSGIRVGSPAMTTRGFGVEEAKLVGKFIARVLDAPESEENLAKVRADVSALCRRFPVYG
jgi:glycine hydroxymethyltransferase